MVTVEDADDEESYGPALERAGFAIRLRQPGHRMYRTPDQDVHVHVFSDAARPRASACCSATGCATTTADRRLYEETKRELARRDWEATNDYSDAKGAVVAEILVRAQRWSEAGPA